MCKLPPPSTWALRNSSILTNGLPGPTVNGNEGEQSEQRSTTRDSQPDYIVNQHIRHSPQTVATPNLCTTRSDETDALPPFTPIQEAEFRWGDIEDGRSFACALNRIYAEIVHWKRNLFKVPSGKARKAFTRELSRMFSTYAERSALETVAMKALMSKDAETWLGISQVPK